MALGPGRPPLRTGDFIVTIPRRVLTPSGRVVSVNESIRDHLVPIPFIPDIVKNIFEPGRAGRPVVRPEDLLALRIELKNIAITPGSPPRLTAQGNSAKLILHFPPQAITEETFFEVPPPDFSPPAEGSEGEHPHPNKQDKPGPASVNDPLRKPPIRARAANESRLVFKVPAGTEIDYTLEAILAACVEFEMVVAANARPRLTRGKYFHLKDLFDQNVLKNLPPKSRAALAAQAISALRISAAAGSGDIVTLRARQGRGGRVFREVPDDLAGAITRPRRYRPKPKRPSATTTAIELPWRLIISPHSGARWRHATTPANSEFTGRTELWHTRLVTPRSDGNEVMPPYPDPNRTIRAIWARSGSGWEAMKPPMQGNWPDPTTELPNPKALPIPGTIPFRMPMDNFDRCQIVHLSSNFSVPEYRPEPVDTNLLMLSSLGGWLDSRGAWDPPGLSVEEWVHRASMARDHYVKVVYRGFLFPFGHRVSLVKVSERKFHNGNATSEQEPGNPAYLRQRYFLIIREKIRTFDDALFRATKSKDHSVVFANQFPFSRIEILLDSTPDLNKPEDDDVAGKGQLMFWPNVGGSPFRFPCVGTDLDGRRVAFDLPMIFLDNTQACPRYFDEATQTLKAGLKAAEDNARLAKDAYDQAPGKNNADFEGQRLALAAPLKSGDTSVEAIDVVFGGETSEPGILGNASLRNYSNDLSRPVFVPKVARVKARIGVMANLTGTADTNSLTWNAHFLRHGFNKDASQEPNRGEVFVDVGGQGKMDFSSQGDKSGGFMQPNLKPLALSRSAGPVTSDVQNFIDGTLDAGAGFSDVSLADLPLPLLFGCIPLAKIIEAVTSHLDEPEKVPKFIQEGGSQVETFINTLVRLYGMVHDLVTDPASVAQGLIDQARLTLNDQVAQSQAYATALVQPVVQKINELDTAITQLKSRLQALAGLAIDTVDSAPDFLSLPTDVANARARIAELKTLANAQVNGVTLPAGFRQSVLNLCDKLDKGLEALEDLAALVAAGKDLYEALDAIVGNPAGLGDLFSDASALSAKLDDVADAVGVFRTALAGFDLLNGAVRTTLLNALQDLEDIFDSIGTLIELLAGDELTIRFDWNPEISSFPNSPGNEIFHVNDKRGLLVAVEGKVKKNGSSTPKISVVCSLRSFDLVLIAPASFIELQFDRIEFSVDSKAKMDVDVLLNEIKFVGPLSFVETLKDLIPLDGFSDPPYLDITPQGIDAGFDIALPTIAVGVLNLSNLSLGAGFTVPFIGQPLAVRFNFCTREQPFQLTVYMFGGGGFFGVTIDPSGVQVLEAAFEFGAAISVNFGVASGGVEVMAGIYFRIENENAMLAGYFRLGGHVDVLGLITASLELYLELSYETSSGKCKGMAQLTIEISVFIFSGSVTITCERKFAGANGDPSLRQMMGLDPALTLEDELDLINGPGVDYAWRDYVEAFA